jgi:primosomal protein N'
VLLARAARLVGPRSGLGRVLVQTRVPEHEVLAAARQAAPAIAATPERHRRAELGFPPFGGLAEVSGDDEAVSVACTELRGHREVTVLGPSAAPARALVQAPTAASLCDAFDATDLSRARSHGRLRIEVDPLRV